MTTPLLDVQDLTTAFRRDGAWREVVHGVSFTVNPRETVALVGESGSGKSVSALSVMRLTPRDASRIGGRVLFEGRDLLALPEAGMRRIRGDAVAMVFQEPMTSLNPVLTIGFQIAEGLMLHRGLGREAAEAEAVRLLDRVRIPAARSRLHDYPHRFSGGMRQRVVIAMALACRPKLLIADEPTTALDVTVQAQILDLLKELQDQEGMAVLFITHDMGVVAEIADRMVVMRHGRAVEAGDTAEIFRGARHPYTRALLSSVPRLGSMAGEARPRAFPIVSTTTGAVDVPAELPDTVVASERPLLEVSGLTTRFDIRGGLLGRTRGRVHAVEGVSFTLAAGETLALVGESGCGKSTTGRSVLRLIEPVWGSVLLDGADVLKLGPAALRERRKRMQMIFQDPFASLDPRMTVGAAIAEPILLNGLGSRGEARERTADLLARVGLTPDMAGRFPHEFSGGQRQRICIARALAVRAAAHRGGRERLGPRRVGQGPGGQSDAGAAGEPRPGVPVHQPRHGGGGTGEPPRGRHVSRRDRRDGAARGDLRRPATPLHAAAARGPSRCPTRPGAAPATPCRPTRSATRSGRSTTVRPNAGTARSRPATWSRCGARSGRRRRWRRA